MRVLLADRNVILIAASYFAMNYSFYLLSNWCFLYLVQERGFSVLAGGWLAMTPALASAAGAGLGGAVTVRLCDRLGVKRGLRQLPLWALLAVAVLLPLTTHASNPYAAVIVLTACFFLVELTEGAFWGATIRVGGADAMAVGGVVNAAGNFGGIVGIPLVAHLSGRHEWGAAFAIGGLTALLASLLWLLIEPEPVSRRALAGG